jgi:hypothetical protein
MAKTEEVELDRESIRVVEWRLQWLRAGGFNKRNARLIAESDIDWRYANELLKNCKAKEYSETFVMDLLL